MWAVSRSKTTSGAYIRTNATYCNEDDKRNGYEYIGDVSEAACMDECKRLHCSCFDTK